MAPSYSEEVPAGRELEAFDAWVGEASVKRFVAAVLRAFSTWAKEAAPSIRVKLVEGGARRPGIRTWRVERAPGQMIALATLRAPLVRKPGTESWAYPPKVFAAPRYEIDVAGTILESAAPTMKDVGGPLTPTLATRLRSLGEREGWMPRVVAPDQEIATPAAVIAFVESLQSWFELDEEELIWSSRAHRQGYEPGEEDIREARRLRDALRSRFGSSIDAQIEEDEEWVNLTVALKAARR
jgi:hypothetical protein